MEYRSEIDGLRAVAVSAVVLNHLNLFNFRGGYLGVDVFFVLSGYLISSILVRELITNGKLSYTNFYFRRVRRIIPGLSFCCALTIVPLWMMAYGSPIFYTYIKSLLSTLFFFSNFFFLNQAGYFAPDVLFSPLLHTWTLGVEEQFYLFAPFLLTLLFKVKSKRLRVLIVFCSHCYRLQLARAYDITWTEISSFTFSQHVCGSFASA